MGNLSNFLGEVREELNKVVWPSKDSTVGTTIVVIIICLLCALYLGVVDFGLSKLTQFIY
ncbi:preprotein translocase subunit SecE [Limisalsivibrio acetivorans]|uniref:preprotein translocase subunit SecE n=1 Tax=Limisalsivibrio acetivorans TaxID=1304888 RepID=UPI0003B567EF|nr:preprotein translocase subunit SecE [Limisalsivibrio acetivorans]